MLTIRVAQLQALQLYVDERFVDELVTHLRTGYPRETRSKSDADLGAHARAALEEARGYQLASKRDVCRFLNLTIAGGLGWRDGATMRWAHELMLDSSIGSPSQRLHRVYCQSAFRL